LARRARRSTWRLTGSTTRLAIPAATSTRRMRPDGAAGPPPGLDHGLCLAPRVEDLPVERLVAELTSLTPSEHLDDLGDPLPLAQRHIGLPQLGDALLRPETLARHRCPHSWNLLQAQPRPGSVRWEKVGATLPTRARASCSRTGPIDRSRGSSAANRCAPRYDARFAPNPKTDYMECGRSRAPFGAP
jgi:hypothetical protein